MRANSNTTTFVDMPPETENTFIDTVASHEMKTSQFISRDTRILLVTVAAIFLSALALRLYAIDAQSLWSDEGSTIALSSRSFEQIFRDTAQDVHPPLYYWILHAWMDLVGSSVFAVRSPSVVCGALTV